VNLTSDFRTGPFSFWSYKPATRDVGVTRKDLEFRLVVRAARDEDFRNDLLRNPSSVLEREYETKLPECMRLHVIDEGDRDVCMVLPYNPYAGVCEEDLKLETGLSLEDIAFWLLHNRRGTLLNPSKSLELVLHAWRHQQFRTEFLTDPRLALIDHLQVHLPGGYRYVAFEESASDLFIVLPRLASSLQGDSSDKLLWEEANLGPTYVHARQSGCTQVTCGLTTCLFTAP